MPWPSNSPDPIENLWSFLDQRATTRQQANEKEFFEALKSTWEAIANDILKNLVNSMPNGCAKVIEAKRVSTLY
jgi:hypothetical protein